MGFYVVDMPVERGGNKEHSYHDVWKELILDKTYTAKDKVVIVDADALVYRISAMCDTRSILVSRGGKTKEFNTRTKFKEYCKSKELDYETFAIEDKIVSEDLSHCLATIKRAIKNIKEGFNATEIIFFLGGSYNARTDLPLPSQYKSNRSEQIRPKHLKGAREYLAKWYNTYVVTDIEADDIVLGVTQHIVNNTSAYCVAWQLDKDFLQNLLPSRYYHPVDDKIYEINGGIGELYEHKKGIKGNGLQWLLLQVFLGDMTDNYSSKQFFSKKYGEKSYYKDFKDITNEKELLSKWWDKWCELLPERIVYTDWKGVEQNLSHLELAEMMFKCAYMRTSPNDNTTFESLLDKYGVTVND